MAKFIKIILFMLFAVALHSVANDYFAEKQAEQDIYMAMSAMKGDTHETVSSPQTPYFPDAELAGTGIQTHQIAMSHTAYTGGRIYFFFKSPCSKAGRP